MRSLADLGIPTNLRWATKADCRLWPAADPPLRAGLVSGEEGRIQPGDNWRRRPPMKFDDTSRFAGKGTSTLGMHICPRCKSTWTHNAVFCDACLQIREALCLWDEQSEQPKRRKKCATNGCRRMVDGIKKYCETCARRRNRLANAERCQKDIRHSRKSQNSPISTGSIMQTEKRVRYGETFSRGPQPRKR